MPGPSQIPDSSLLPLPHSEISSPHSGQSTGSLTVLQRADSLEDGRKLAILQALRLAGVRGLSGTPRIGTEGLLNGLYTAVVEFPGTVSSLPGQDTSGKEQTGSADNSVPNNIVHLPGTKSKPSWVLLLPVESRGNGRAEWGPDSAWSRLWVAPLRSGGTRFVSIMGDADDRAQMHPELLADPDNPATERSALALARKFGAPAVVELLSDGAGGIRAVLWRAGVDAKSASTYVDGGDARKSSIDLLASLFSASPNDGKSTQEKDVEDSSGVSAGEQTSNARPVVDIEEHPEYSQDSGFGFAVVLASHSPDEIETLRRAVAALPGVWIASSQPDADGAIVTGSFPGNIDEMQRNLVNAGFRISD